MGRVRVWRDVTSLVAIALFPLAAAVAQTEAVCGTTTLRATVRDTNGDGILDCAPGEGLVVRSELAVPEPSRAETRRSLTAVVTLADFQLPDEESPLRGEFFDKCFEQNPAKAGFRPQETLLAHMVNAHVSAANRIIAEGSPVLGRPVDFAFLLGDLAENQHLNEVQWVLSLMAGEMLDPDSGADGYDGVQANDPAGRGDITTPVSGTPIVDLANEPFITAGLRSRDGAPFPWYSVMGNHDTKVQGTVPDDIPGWRDLARNHALGSLKINDLAPDRQQEACEVILSRPQDLASFLQDLLTDAVTDPTTVGTVGVVPADPQRRLVNKEQWIEAFAGAPGEPAGHGFLPVSNRCPDTYDDPFARRACYSFVRGQFHYIVLDGNPAEGLDGGNIDDSQFQWLREQLRSSSTSYLDDAGKQVRNANATDRMIVIVSHHPMRRFDNTGTAPGTSSNHTADDLTKLLLRFPNVILHLAGHSHENKIVPHRDDSARTSYWEVNTASIADWPNQSRMVEIADNRDGTLSIFTVVFDGAVDPNPRRIAWTDDDSTSEIAAGEAHRINESWLAALGWETAFHDPQTSSAPARAVAQGTANDRNAELILEAPAFLVPPARPAAQSPSPGRPSLPATGSGPTDGLAIAALLIIGFLALRRRAT